MNTPHYFGFGSLVNEQTLPKGARWQKATLRGWRRSWRHPIPGTRTWAAMDVLPDENSSIDGLLLVGGEHIDQYLVQREAGYCAATLDRKVLELEQPLGHCATPCLWRSKSPHQGTTPLWLMQSYIDVVMVGYLRHFGEAGLQRFVESTDNWHLPTFDDREQPRYPRSINLSKRERELIAAMQPGS